MLYLASGEQYLVAGNQQIWQNWADILHRWGVEEVMATLLEAVGPLNFIGAQIIYVGQPLLNSILPEDHVIAFADLLDNPEETRAFTRFLRQGEHSD